MKDASLTDHLVSWQNLLESVIIKPDYTAAKVGFVNLNPSVREVERRMFVRAISITLLLNESFSLKDKRQILRSFMARTRNKFNVAIAEIGSQDQWQLAQIGVAFLSNQLSHLDAIQQEILNFIENQYPVEITDLTISDL